MINSRKNFFKNYKIRLNTLIEEISSREVFDFIDALLDTRERDGIVYFVGNGGSASTASHFANDLSIGVKVLGKPFRAISLCDNQSIITAIANDNGYEEVFSKQLSVLLKKEDMVVAISASGNSKNLIEAIELAKELGVITAGLTAFDGGRLKRMADVSIHIPTNQGEYGPAEDIHMMLDHLITNYLTSTERNSQS